MPISPTVGVDPMNCPGIDLDGRPRARLWLLVHNRGGTRAEMAAARELEMEAFTAGRDTLQWSKFEKVYRNERERQGLAQVNL